VPDWRLTKSKVTPEMGTSNDALGEDYDMQMVDVGMKDVTEREAIGEGILRLKPAVINLIKAKKIPKGDVLEAARLAGILGAKKTSEVIPLCHPISIEHIRIEFSLKNESITIKALVKGHAKTGFEMEALTAVAIAGLTIYDMCKPFDKDMVLGGIKLVKKSGGKSGTYVR